MTFSEQLNKYIKQIECSSKDLVISSGLTSSVISRYRRGDRTPSLKSKQLEQLTDGLYKLSLTRKMNITKEEIYTALSDTLNDISIDFEQLSKNFNELVSTLNINIADLSRFISYDASFVSKIFNNFSASSIPPSAPFSQTLLIATSTPSFLQHSFNN